MFILRKIDNGTEYNIMLGENYQYIRNDNSNKIAKERWEQTYESCFDRKVNDCPVGDEIIGFVTTNHVKMDDIDARCYPISRNENAYIMTSSGETFCKLY